jgi:hypothetical protein
MLFLASRETTENVIGSPATVVDGVVMARYVATDGVTVIARLAVATSGALTRTERGSGTTRWFKGIAAMGKHSLSNRESRLAAGSDRKCKMQCSAVRVARNETSRLARSDVETASQPPPDVVGGAMLTGTE